ncbi:MAG: 50S ribosomal protein L25/general stress protein Ctc [Rikenellaceae bacterium]
MKTLEFKATKREAGGKKGAKALRVAGLVPCVIYGGGENIHFSVSEKEIKTLIYTPLSHIVDFDIDGKHEKVVMRDVQYHPVREEILHIDFYRIQEGKPLVMEVPIELIGAAQGVKEGGKLSLSKRKVFISGLVENLPDTVEVDVTNMKLGGSIFVGDLVSDKYSFVTPASTAICAVRMTRAAIGAAAKGE